MPKVSILIPTFNRLAYLREALHSACTQTLGDIEILVSDDGSTDGTVDFLRHQEALDPRIRVTARNPNPGLFQNVNHLLAEVRGDAFCILADDDLLGHRFAERLSNALEDEPSAVAAFCDHDIIDQQGVLLEQASRENSRTYGRLDLPNGIVQRPQLAAVGLSMCMGFSLYGSRHFARDRFELTCGGAADVDMALRAAVKGPLYYVAEVLGSYRTHAQAATKTRRLFMSEGFVAAMSRHSLSDPEAEVVRRRKLQDARVRLLPHLSATDRFKMARILKDYLLEGGKPTNPRVVLASALAILPRRAATWLLSRVTSA